jgi:hypothetical protein
MNSDLHTSTRTRRRAAAAVLVTGLVVLVLWLWAHRDAPAPLVAPLPSAPGLGEEQVQVAADPGEDLRSQASRGSVTVGASGVRSSIFGRVRDAEFGIPVVAEVRPNVGPSVYSGAVDGRFELSRASREMRQIVASAPGYESQIVTRSAAVEQDGIAIVLTASHHAAVIADYEDGQPAVGVRVTWRATTAIPERGQLTDWISARAHAVGTVRESRTDDAGRTSIATGTPVIATVHDADAGVSQSVRVRPDEEVRIRLARDPLRIQFVDMVTRAPVPGLTIETWSPRSAGAMATEHTTDADGTLAVSVSSVPLILRRPGSASWQSELIPLTDGMTRTGTGGKVMTMVRIDAAPAGRTGTIGVGSCGRTLLLRDAQSGAPIDALVRTRFRNPVKCSGNGATITGCTVYTPRCPDESADEVYRSVAGEFQLPCLLREAMSASSTANPEPRLMLTVAGYVPEALPLSTLRGAQTTGPAEVRLTPCGSRQLRVSFADGTPFEQAVLVYAPRGDVVVWKDDGRSTGVHGPFDWVGGELLVRAGDGKEWNARIAESECASTPELTVVLSSATGAIEVDDVPDGYCAAALVAKLGLSIKGVIHVPTSSASGQCRFEALPPGTYLVGPRKWVEGAELHGLSQEVDRDIADATPRAVVESGKTTKIPWRAAWASGRQMDGTITVRGGSQERVVVVPMYGNLPDASLAQDIQVPRMVFGRRSDMIPLDTKGRYRIDAMDPVPLLLVVCMLGDGNWGTVQNLQVVGTLKPGESLEVSLGSVELTWAKGDTRTPITVRYEVPPSALRYPVQTFHSARELRWTTDQPLRIDDVPVVVSELTVQGRTLAVQVKEDTVTPCRVDVDELRAASR